MSVGSDLRQIRESKNITLESVSQKTKIPVKFLEAIEEDNFKVFPSHTYARGFIRAYAKVVGSDVYVITRQFNSQIQPETVKLEPPHVEEQAPVPLELKGERPKGHFSHESRLPEGSLKLEMVEEPVAEPADLGVAVDSPQVSATEPTVLDFRLPSARKRSISWKFLPPLLISAAVVLGVALVGYYGWKAVSKIHWSLPKHEAAVEVAREESAPPPVADKYQHLILKA